MEKKHTEEQKEMSYFELNLETWRQLWRVLEISDIVLVIVDIRYPVRHILIRNFLQKNPFSLLLLLSTERIVPTVAVRVRNETTQQKHDHRIEQNRFGVIASSACLETLLRTEIPEHPNRSIHRVSNV